MRLPLVIAMVALAGAAGCIRVKLDPVDVKLDVKLQVESQLNEAMPPDMRDRFARTLDEDAAEAYEDSFNRAVRKRWPELGLEIENR